MRIIPACILIITLTFTARAQETVMEPASEPPASFDAKTKFVSFGLGFPNLYRLGYDEPAGYTHIKTTGIGPIYIKFETALTKNIGIAGSFGYSTFHYSYYGWAYFPGYQQKVIYQDDVNVMNFGISGNYHFTNLVKNEKIDLYAGAGASLNYLHYIYSNIPPYREPDSDLKLLPIIRIGARYYLDRKFNIFGEAGFDGTSILVAGLSIRL